MEYFTVRDKASSSFTEKRSKFLGYITHIQSEEHAAEFIENIKRKHFDARHNVYAYRLKQNNIYRYSDDAEPSGTAGMPILEVLKKNEIFDAAIVVSRYFGGILLGTGGLTRAYSKAAKDALNNAEISKMVLCREINLSFDYKLMNSILHMISCYRAKILQKTYGDKVTVNLALDSKEIEKFSQGIKNISANKLSTTLLEEKYFCL